MSESKHTPGPWRLGRAGGTVVAGDPAAPFGEDRSTEAYYGGDLIAESIGRDADATLIARAPDLLREVEELRAQNAELLEALEFIVNDSPEPGEDAVLSVGGYNRACAAIAKAKGGAE